MAEIKFCGLTRPEDAREAARLGASYLGVIFASGPRLIAPDRAREVFAAAGPGPLHAGVFATATPDEVAPVVAGAELHVVQLHGGATPTQVRAMRDATGALVWAVLRVGADGLPAAAADLFEAADAVVLDALVPGRLGGTGVALDWAALADQVRRVRGTGRLVLAGGLDPSNVGAAIALLDPDVVDVSSGVESAPGIKDHQRLRAFRDAVRASGRLTQP